MKKYRIQYSPNDNRADDL